MHRIILVSLMAAVFAGCNQQATQSQVSDDAIMRASFNKAGAPTVEFSVPDMMCPEGCGAKVKEILAAQPGAKDVLVEFDSKTVKVAVDKDKFDAKQAVAALVDHQFKNSTLKDATASTPAPSAPA